MVVTMVVRNARITGSSSTHELTPSMSSADIMSDAFCVVPFAGRGMGWRASRNIEVGERLLAERPLVEQGPERPQLAAAVAALSATDRQRYFELTQNVSRFGEVKTARGIFETNAHPCHDYSAQHRAVFPLASRANHACYGANNATYKWNSQLRMLTVHATRRIRVGDEICVSYGYPEGCRLRAERQRHLLETFGFACGCAKCELSGDDLAASEQRLAIIQDEATFLSELTADRHLAVMVEAEVRHG